MAYVDVYVRLDGAGILRAFAERVPGSARLDVEGREEILQALREADQPRETHGEKATPAGGARPRTQGDYGRCPSCGRENVRLFLQEPADGSRFELCELCENDEIDNCGDFTINPEVVS